MGFSNGAKSIVQDGLVFAIDADNILSYPGSGTTCNSLVSTNNTGSMTDMTVVDKPGGLGQSFYWNETSNEGLTFNNTGQEITNPEMTLELWFQTEGAISHDFVMQAGSAGSSGVNAKFQLTRLYIYNSDSSTGGIYNADSFTTDTWQHMAICITGSATADQKFYTNGIAKTFSNNSNTGANFAAKISTPVTIGKDSAGSNNFDGYISEMRTYNRVLSEAEVLQNFNATKHKYGL